MCGNVENAMDEFQFSVNIGIINADFKKHKLLSIAVDMSGTKGFDLLFICGF